MRYEQARFDLFLTHRAALIDYATPIVGERSRAEDVVQDAFLRFVPAPRAADANVAMEEASKPASYLYRVVRNLAFDIVRRRRTEQRQDEAPPWWMLPIEASSPEQELIQRQALERVDAVLASLDMPVRLAVEMSRFGGYTLQEIAIRLSVSVPSAHRLVRQGLMKIALVMDDRE